MRRVSARTALCALLPFALHALARAVDEALGILLHSTLDLPGFVPEALGLVDLDEAARGVVYWIAGGAAVWIALAALRRRREGGSFGAALAAEAGCFSPLYLRPAVTLLALASLAVQPTFPYGSALPVALTQDWGIAQDLAALAALIALAVPARATLARLPAPPAGAVFFIAFLGYALLTPERVRHWEGHPGNEPKYLRMGVSLGWSLSLDVADVSALPEDSPPLETLEPGPLLPAAGRAAATLLRESALMVGALGEGREAFGAGAIRAARLARQTVAGKQGGVFHVLSPGPSLLLAPTLRIDRVLNRARGTPGRVAVTVLAWNAMGAALVAALFLLMRDVTGRPGLAALVAGGVALVPPFLFYSFQFYPELPGALLLALLFHRLLFGGRFSRRALWSVGMGLAFLPWLHQKFLAVWAVLVVMAVIQAVDQLVTLRGLLALVVPQALSLYLTALWNFAITGSARPDALFLAWGPAGVSSARVHEGFFGLLFDARFGLLPYAPFYLLAAGGWFLGARAGRRLLLALPAALAYYLTVAAADNWSGAVCNLGRYVMPVVPLFVALTGIVLDRVGARRGVLTMALVFAGISGVLALELWQDPRAANDSALLLARSTYADGNVYVPNVFFRSPLYQASGRWARTLAWLALAAVLGAWLQRAARGRAGASAPRALAGLLAAALGIGLVLERWPSPARAPRFGTAIELGAGLTAFVSGPVTVQAGQARAASGVVEILVRGPVPIDVLTVTAAGEGDATPPGRPPLRLDPRGTRFHVPVSPLRALAGRRGAHETLSRGRLKIESPGEVTLWLGNAGDTRPLDGSRGRLLP